MIAENMHLRTSYIEKSCLVLSSLGKHACGVSLNGLLDCHEHIVHYALMVNAAEVVLVKMWAQNEQLHHLLELVWNETPDILKQKLKGQGEKGREESIF